MNWDEQEDTMTYKVVINHEEQYSIWPADREKSARGGAMRGKSGPKADCLAHIKEVWTDMRPAEFAPADGRGSSKLTRIEQEIFTKGDK